MQVSGNTLEVARLSPDERTVLDIVLRALGEKYPGIEFNPTTRAFEDGLADSLFIADIIMEVEARTGRLFDATSFDLDVPLTPLRLAQAFK